MWANKCALFLVINGSRFCEGLSGFFINDDSVFFVTSSNFGFVCL